jgi:hypothetical protein
MKIDPYKHKEKYLAWKERVRQGIPEISKENSDIILKYVNDMEIGANVSAESVKGSRSFNRLNTLRDKMCFFARNFEKRLGLIKITDITEEQLITFFADMKTGTIRKKNGGTYSSVTYYVSIFKSFWHWHQKISKKKGIEVQDITVDLDIRAEKPAWVYLTEEQVKELAESSKSDRKTLIYFLFDTGIRAPTELINVRVSDLFNDFKELNIRDDASKTFGRRIKLMICSDIIREYVRNNKLEPTDQLFDICPSAFNKYLKRVASKLFGEGISPAGEKYCNLTMYDFRHCSCCYWLPRYKSESALKYRFGWKKSDKIHYYSELLGMRDTISEDDVLIDITKTEIEKELQKTKKENELMQERMSTIEAQLAEIMKWSKKIEMEVKNG